MYDRFVIPTAGLFCTRQETSTSARWTFSCNGCSLPQSSAPPPLARGRSQLRALGVVRSSQYTTPSSAKSSITSRVILATASWRVVRRWMTSNWAKQSDSVRGPGQSRERSQQPRRMLMGSAEPRLGWGPAHQSFGGSPSPPARLRRTPRPVVCSSPGDGASGLAVLGTRAPTAADSVLSGLD